MKRFFFAFAFLTLAIATSAQCPFNDYNPAPFVVQDTADTWQVVGHCFAFNGGHDVPFHCVVSTPPDLSTVGTCEVLIASMDTTAVSYLTVINGNCNSILSHAELLGPLPQSVLFSNPSGSITLWFSTSSVTNHVRYLCSLTTGNPPMPLPCISLSTPTQTPTPTLTYRPILDILRGTTGPEQSTPPAGWAIRSDGVRTYRTE